MLRRSCLAKSGKQGNVALLQERRDTDITVRFSCERACINQSTFSTYEINLTDARATKLLHVQLSRQQYRLFSSRLELQRVSHPTSHEAEQPTVLQDRAFGLELRSGSADFESV